MKAHLVRLPPSTGGRVPGIEGLRAIAASSVLVYHAWAFSNPGADPIWDGTVKSAPFETLAFGLTLFFVLSGFLLYRPFVSAALEGRRLSVGAYLRNRALRILPAYWVILLVTSLVLAAGTVQTASGFDHARLDPGELATASFFVQGYRPDTLLLGIGPAWSLAVEVVFYFALPVLGLLALVLARRATNPRRILIAVLVPVAILLIIGMSGRLVAGLIADGDRGAGWNDNWISVLIRSFWVQADLFAYGMVVAVAFAYAKKEQLRLPAAWRPVAAAVAIVGGGIALARLLDLGGELGYPIENSIVAAAIATVLALVVMPRRDGRPSRMVGVLELPFVVGVGLVSYSLFLWQEPLRGWLADHDVLLHGGAGLFANIAIVAAVAGALSVLTYRFVEVPALRHKASMREPTREVAERTGPVPLETASADRPT
jgi:peptidoglycan/LPS O-acetylase OafA/YrhL